MTKLLYLPLAVICLMACSKGIPDAPDPEPEQMTLKLADPLATAETKALYSNLWAIRDKGWMFGHHDDLMYGRYWYGENGGSDTKAVCGDYPAVYSLDFSTFMDDRAAGSKTENDLRLKCIKEAYDRGMVIIACLHLDNPLTGGNAWDNSSKEVAGQILTEGTSTRNTFNGWLDNLADLAKGLKGSDDRQIPIILRPFHEHTQSWSWWGSSCTSETEFKELWRYLVTYMRQKGVHNFIYAISPQMDGVRTESDFLFRWPGDDYVDFIGMDCYQGINNNVFVTNLKVLKNLSEKKKKPAGVTETGVEGFTVADYWLTNIAAPMAGRKMSLLVTWRNKYVSQESDKHFFSVYPGHVSEESFRAMYSRGDTYFCKDLPDMYIMAKDIAVD